MHLFSRCATPSDLKRKHEKDRELTWLRSNFCRNTRVLAYGSKGSVGEHASMLEFSVGTTLH